MSQTNWNTPVDFHNWKTTIEKRMANQERRFYPRQAADIMGPSLGPFAVRILDWNSDEAMYDGIVYSEEIALNAPENGKQFMGWTNGTSAGFGLQWATEFVVDDVWTPWLWVRRFWDLEDGSTRMFSEWTKVNADEREDEAIEPWSPVKPVGFTVEAAPGGINCYWNGEIDGGGNIPIPGFRNLEIRATS